MKTKEQVWDNTLENSKSRFAYIQKNPLNKQKNIQESAGKSIKNISTVKHGAGGGGHNSGGWGDVFHQQELVMVESKMNGTKYLTILEENLFQSL